MAKGPTMKFPEPNAERAMQVANYGMDSMREMTEHSLNRSKALFEGILTTTRKTVENIDQQASEIRERSMSLAAETLSNTFDFAPRQGTAGATPASERVYKPPSAGSCKTKQRAGA